jgi:hypothetical protein
MGWKIVLNIAVVLVMSGTPGDATDPDSPLSWREVERQTSVSESQALELAQTYLGTFVDPATHQMVVITDQDDLGEPVCDRVAYLTLFRSIHLERTFEDEPDSVCVDLYVAVDGETGALVLAFTPVRDVWVERMFEPRSPDSVAVQSHWTLAPPPADGMKSNVIEVLQAVFEQFGRKYVDGGQMVIRPRWVQTKFPASKVDGTYVPKRSPGPAWLVHTMGEIVFRKSPPPGIDHETGDVILGEPYYFTEMIMLVDDATLEICPCPALP